MHDALLKQIFTGVGVGLTSFHWAGTGQFFQARHRVDVSAPTFSALVLPSPHKTLIDAGEGDPLSHCDLRTEPPA